MLKSQERLEVSKAAKKRTRTAEKGNAPPPKVQKRTESNQSKQMVSRTRSGKKSKARNKPLDPQPDVLPRLVLNPRNRRFPPKQTATAPTATAPREGTTRTEYSTEQQRMSSDKTG